MSRRAVRYMLTAVFSLVTGAGMAWFVYTYAYPFWAAVMLDTWWLKISVTLVFGAAAGALGALVADMVLHYHWYYRNGE